MSCTGAVRTALEGIEGVSDVKVDFDNKSATCTVEGDVKDATLVKAIPDRFTVSVKQ